MAIKNSFKQLPDDKGYFGAFGGRYVSETLMPLIIEVEKEYEKIKNESSFKEELNHYMETYIGRPSPLFFAKRITSPLKFGRKSPPLKISGKNRPPSVLHLLVAH